VGETHEGVRSRVLEFETGQLGPTYRSKVSHNIEMEDLQSLINDPSISSYDTLLLVLSGLWVSQPDKFPANIMSPNALAIEIGECKVFVPCR